MIKLNSKDITPMMNGVQLSRVMYNGKQVWPEPMNVVEVQLSDTVAGDVCAYDGSNKRFFRFVDSGATDNIKNYTPIGVVVVPASHTDDGTARVISLAAMDYNNPDSGNTSENVHIYWGGDNYDISTLPNLTQAPYIAEQTSAIASPQQIVGWDDFYNPEFCSDYYVDTSNSFPNPFDSKAAWGSGTPDKPAPSPYLEDGSKNEIYRSAANTGNVYADMDGKSNTGKILTVDNGGSTYWQTATTITNTGNTETIHPAAQCCWRFHTKGTTQGEWYLPSGGELGYLAARWKAINASISKVASFGFSALSLPVANYWWSSTEYPSYIAIYLFFVSNYAYLGKGSKSFNYCCVRAFLAVSLLDQLGVSPSEASNGVYVYANNGKLYTPEEWDTANNDLAVGVAVVSRSRRFAITKGEKPQRAWSAALYRTDVSGLTNYDDSSQAVTDFNGESNTSIIREAASGENDSNGAAYYCYNQTVSISGRGTVHGYLPALGELQAVYNNKSSVDNAMSLIGGTAMPTDYWLWSSTESDWLTAWCLYCDGGYLLTGSKVDTNGYAVPIFPLD